MRHAMPDDQPTPNSPNPTDPAVEQVGAHTTRVKPLGSLAFPQFRLLITSALLGSVGTQMREVINLWVVYELTGSALHLGILGALRVIPLVVLGLLGGVLADMIDRRKLLQFGQISGLAFTALTGVLALTGTLQWWHVYIITLLATSATTLDEPARMALVNGSVPRTHLLNAVTLSSTVHQASILLGPSLGGMIIALANPGIAYMVNSGLFIASVLAVLALRDIQAVEGRKRPSFNRRELLEGLHFVLQTPIILALITLDFGVVLFTSYRMLTPLFAEDILGKGAAGMGALQTAPAVGFLIASGVLLMLGDVKKKGLAVVIGVIGYAIATFAFAVSEVFLLSLFFMALMGAFDGIGSIVRKTTVQLLVPDEIRGRATAVMQVFTRGTTSAGFVATGAIAAAFGASAALMIGAVLAMIALIAVLLTWRQFLAMRT
jgi:MFS family permease